MGVLVANKGYSSKKFHIETPPVFFVGDIERFLQKPPRKVKRARGEESWGMKCFQMGKGYKDNLKAKFVRVTRTCGKSLTPPYTRLNVFLHVLSHPQVQVLYLPSSGIWLAADIHCCFYSLRNHKKIVSIDINRKYNFWQDF